MKQSFTWVVVTLVLVGCVVVLAPSARAQGGAGDKGVSVVLPKGDTRAHTTQGPPAGDAPSATPAAGGPAMGLPPVGAVTAWLKSLPGTPPLPADWVECNGQVLNVPGSPLNGATAPNLNGAGEGTKRFLRGSRSSGAEGGSNVHDHGPFLVQRQGDRRINVAARKAVEHLPPYHEVVWIMRVK